MRIPRFDSTERWVHWATATLFLLCIATAIPLYVGSIGAMIGRRELVRTIHVYCGLGLPVPLLVGVCTRRWGRALRADIARINRWTRDDKRWVRTWGRDKSIRSGKFNGGQKLNSAFVSGAILVMLATGSIMKWFNHFPNSWRTGATFVHDLVFIAALVMVAGHLLYAFADWEAIKGITIGKVSGAWARRHAPRWYEEMTGDPADEQDAWELEKTP